MKSEIKTRILTTPTTQQTYAVVESRQGNLTVTFQVDDTENDAIPLKAYTGNELLPLSIHKVDAEQMRKMRVCAEQEFEEWMLDQYAPSPKELEEMIKEATAQAEWQFEEMCKMY